GTGAGMGGGGPGREVTVVDVDNFAGDEEMRDLTVADIHTYYVLADDEPVLVHNCGEDLYDHGGTTRYGALDGQGRATFASTVLHPDGIRRGTPASRDWEPPGWSGDGVAFNEARGHLLGNKLGGLGTGHTKRHNIVTLQQKPLNSPYMRDQIEKMVHDHVLANKEIVQYTVTGIYGPGKTAPIGLRVEAYGNKGFELDVSLINPGGR
ncbi:DNA/RNA non-specific endonuclease, partial [Micromonospora chalcea]